jgi:hypothetical protein
MGLRLRLSAARLGLPRPHTWPDRTFERLIGAWMLAVRRPFDAESHLADTPLTVDVSSTRADN